MHWPRPAVSTAVFRDGEVLLVQRAKPPLTAIWSFPGGHVEPGETVAAAALRELREETGVEARIDGLVDVVDVIRRDDDGVLAAHYVITCFHAQWLAGEPRADSDAAAAAFVAATAIDGYRLTSGAAELIGRARRLHLLAGKNMPC